MAGLLEPRGQGLLALAAGLMSPTLGGSFGGALGQGLQGYQQAYGSAQRLANEQDRLGLMREKYAFEMEGAKEARAKQKQFEDDVARAIGLGRPVTQQQVEQAYAQRQADNRQQLGLPDGGWGAQASPVAQPRVQTGPVDMPRQGPIVDHEAWRRAATQNPEFMARLQSLLLPPQRKVMNVNGKLVYEDDPGKVVADYSEPAFNPSRDLLKPDGTPNDALINAKGRVAAAGATRVQNVIPGQQKSEDKAEGEFLVKDYYDNVVPAADAGRQLIPQYESLRRNIQQGAFTTGAAPAARQALAEGLALLGVEKAGEAATSAQTMRAALSEVVLQKQIAQKGPQTESDAKRIEATSASLGNTPEANMFLVDMAEAISRRDIARERFFAEWKAEKGTYQGARAAWNKGEGGRSLFDSPMLQRYKDVSQQQQERPPLSSFFK